MAADSLGETALDSAQIEVDDGLPRWFDSDEQFHAAQPDPKVAEAVRVPGIRLDEVVATVMDGYADRPALGSRSYELVGEAGRTTQRLLPRFETISYRELGFRVSAVASAWRNGDTKVDPGAFVGILGYASTDYTIVDLACIELGAVAVPLPAATADVLSVILDETEPQVLCASVHTLSVVISALLACDASPARIVLLDYTPEDVDQRNIVDMQCQRLRQSRTPIPVHALSEVIAQGASLPRVTPPPVEGDADPLACLLYTSGSTGTPKGAMYTEHIVIAPWLQVLPAAISLNYLPMSHMYGRAFLYSTLANGGTAYFAAKPDMSTFFEDLALVRPTSLNLVPRICEMIIHRYQGELARRAAEHADPEILKNVVADDIRRNLLGGRYLWANCSTAPLSAQNADLIRQVLDVPLVISYGSTETGGIVIDGTVLRPPVIDYKLADVPELGYFCTDTPHPRGELLALLTYLWVI